MATIKVKNSVSSGSDPTGLTFGELAVNITDKKIYIGNAVGSTITLHDQNGLVTSVNGATGAITNVAKTDTAQTFTATQQFAAGISAAGATFATAIRVEGFVDVGLGGGGNSTNLMVGNQALDANISGLNNVAVGYAALGSNTTGTSNSAIGANTLGANADGGSNTAIGSGALQYSVSNSNTAVGYNSLNSLGFFSLGNGSNNTAIGTDAGKSDISLNPLWGFTGGVFVGYDTRAGANSGTNEIVIGYEGRGNGSNTTTIGNTSTTDAYIHGLLRLPDGISAANLLVNSGATFEGNLSGATAAFTNQVTVGTVLGVNKIDPQWAADINSSSGSCIRLIYNSSSGNPPTNYVLFAVSSSGDLTLTPSGGDVSMNANMGMNDKTLSRVEFLDYFERLSEPTINPKNSTLTLDLSVSQVFKVNLDNAITTITISNVPDNGNTNAVGFTLILVADGTARSVTWPGSVKWPANTPPTLTSTNAKADIFSFISTDGGSNWYAFVGGQDF